MKNPRNSKTEMNKKLSEESISDQEKNACHTVAAMAGTAFFKREEHDNTYSYVRNAKLFFGGDDDQVCGLLNEMLHVEKNKPEEYFSYITNTQDQDTFQESNEELFKKKSSVCIIRFRRLDGTYVWSILIRVLTEPDEENRRWIYGSIQDVTYRHNLRSEHLTDQFVKAAGSAFFEIAEINYATQSVRVLMSKQRDTAGIDIRLSTASGKNYWLQRCIYPEEQQEMEHFFDAERIREVVRKKEIPKITYHMMMRSRKIAACTSQMIRIDPGKFIFYSRLLDGNDTGNDAADLVYQNTVRIEQGLCRLFLSNVILAAGFDMTTGQRVLSKYDVLPPKFSKKVTLNEIAVYIMRQTDERDNRELMECFEDSAATASMMKSEYGRRTIECRYKNAAGDKGQMRWIEINLCYYENYITNHMNIFFFVRDINERKNKELRLYEQAQEDPVTGLMNRVVFEKSCQWHWKKKPGKRGQAPNKTLSALLIIEIQNFKRINDMFGRAFGDKILNHVADALRIIAHKDDLIARFGGGEFAMCFWEVKSREALEEFVQILSNALRYQVSADFTLQTSIGVTVNPIDGRTFEELYEKASLALKEAGESTVNTFAFYKAAKQNDKLAEAPASKAEMPVCAVPVHDGSKGGSNVRIRTFGYFDVFANGQAIAFKHVKAKELLALLVDRQGGFISSHEAISYLWEDEEANKTTLSRYRKVAMRLKQTLESYGIGNIIETRNGERRIVQDKVTCDLYQYNSGDARYKELFKGNYMMNYSWGEVTLADLMYSRHDL